MPAQKADHLARHLKIRHPPVEINPVKTLQLQTDMPRQDIVHTHHTSHHDLPPGSGQLNQCCPGGLRPDGSPTASGCKVAGARWLSRQ
jgi:hypothetical protein